MLRSQPFTEQISSKLQASRHVCNSRGEEIMERIGFAMKYGGGRPLVENGGSSE
jgi:hypothetical protein